MRKIVLVVIITLFAMLVGCTGESQNIRSESQNISSASQNMLEVNENDVSGSGVANWVSTAVTIDQLAAEADLIARVQVTDVPSSRELQIAAPQYEDETVVGQGTDSIPFTDSEMLVLETFKGTADKTITVMQTGGILIAADGSAINIVTHEDPIFKEGDEYILFLIDISDDPIHGQGRKLYRTVNPAGRYLIQGKEVFSPYEFPESFTPPKTVDQLLAQIQEAAQSE